MKRLRSILAVVGLGVLGLLLFYFRPAPQVRSLNLGLDGCWEVEPASPGHELTCTRDPLTSTDQQPIRIIVRDASDAELSASCQGGTAVECNKHASATAAAFSPATHCLELHPNSKDKQRVTLKLSARSGRSTTVLGQQTVLVVSRQRTVLEDLRQTWQAIGGQPESLHALRKRAQAEANAQPAGELKERLLLLATNIRYEELTTKSPEQQARDESEAVERELQEALQVARQRHWLRTAADLLEELSWLYRTHSDAVQEMEMLLNTEQWLPLLPKQRLHCYRLLAEAALKRQDLRLAERYQTAARADADTLHDAVAQQAATEEDAGVIRSKLELQVQRLSEQALSASRPEVEKGLCDLETLAMQTGPPCDRAYLWGSIGWLRLLMDELGWPSAGDAKVALLKAIRLRESQSCPGNAQALANLWANMARVHSGDFWRYAALAPQLRENAVDQMNQAKQKLAAALGSQPMSNSLQIDQLLVDARAHLLNQKPTQALASLELLLQRATTDQSPLERWLAMVHKGDAYQAAGQPVAALQSFREAERELLSLQQRVPIYLSHRLMLARYEYSSQRAIALALQLKRPAEALEILRQAGQRALGLTTTPWWQQLTATADPQWQQREKQQADYLDRRRRYEEQLKRAVTLNKAECRELGQAKASWLGVLDELFRSPAPTLFTPPVPPLDELLLGCAQQGQEWVCLATSAGTTQVVPIPQRELDRDAVEQLLLPALAPRIRRANKVRVLAHGALAQLELAAMQLDGQPLGTQKPLRYTVDLPALPAVAPPTTALLVATPEDNIPEFSPALAQKLLAPALAGIPVIARTASLPPSGTGWSWQQAHSPDVLTNLEQSGIFIYFGHVEAMPCETDPLICSRDDAEGLVPDPRLTAMCLTQNTAVWAGDLLAARKVPQRVFLFGCASTDRSKTNPAELHGLAQAVALRGAQVLAFARAIPAPAAAEVVCALGQQPLSNPNFDLDQFVMDTQAHLARGERCVARGKWHMPRYTAKTRFHPKAMDWAALRSYGP